LVVEASHRVNALMQRPAKHHVHFLKAATDGEDGHTGVDRRDEQRQRRRIACGIVQRAGRTGVAAIVVRFDIRIATGKQQSVDRLKNLGGGLTVAERGQQHRQRL
jgi:hypothetical protein